MKVDYLEKSVVDLFDTWVANTPDATAVELNGKTLTYAGLRDASLHVSNALLAAGVQPGDMVPILSQMSLELLPAILGVLKVGACYVPIDMAAWSKARIEATLEDIAPRVAIVTTSPPDTDALRVPTIVSFQEQWLRSSFDDRDGVCRQLGAIRDSLDTKALVYVTFTSGTTGKPKGVMVYHHALHLFATLTSGDAIRTAAGERVLLAFSISFDACAATIWSTITRGGALAMATWSAFPEVAATCDTLVLTPSMLATLDPAGSYYDKVRSVYLGAEATNFDIARQWITPTRKVIHTYGPSEATIVISYGRVPEDAEPDLGVFNPGVEVFLVDDDLQESEVGEILISGPCLAAGYLNNRELTEKKFIQWKGKRVYRSGDLARRTKRGLAWVGRADRMVKNRGFLVNLETEVEAGMLRFRDVRAASALMWRGRLVGFVQPATVPTEQLRVFLKAHCDPFVVPDAILASDRLPLTAHGKVDRAALAAQWEDRMAQADAGLDTMVCTSPHDALRWAFAKCLHVPLADLDGEASFTRLGGHSLAAISLSKLLRQQGYAIAITHLLRGDTIGALENKVTRMTLPREGLDDSSDTVPTEPEAQVLATDMHKLMLSQSLRNPVVNCLVTRAKFVGGPQASVPVPTPGELRAAWITTLGAHSVFRTRYDLQSWTLHDLDHVNLDWDEVCVDADEFDDKLLSVDKQVWADHRGLKRPRIDIPFCHMTCVYAPNRKAIGIVWKMHHVLIDIFSGILLLRDLETALAKTPPAVVAPGPRLRDFARFMQTYKAANLAAATDFWTNMMKPFYGRGQRQQQQQEQPIFQFRPPPAPCLDADNAWRLLPFATRETVGSIEAAAHTHGISTATLINAAWALVLAEHTRCSSFVPFVLSRAGRTVPWPLAPSLVAAMNCRVFFATSIPAGATVHAWLADMHRTLLRSAELENLCQSLDPSVYPGAQFNTAVQAFLYMPELPTSWEVHDRMTGQAEPIAMVWRVQPTADGAVEAALEIDQRELDGEWAQGVGRVAVEMLEWLAHAQGDARLGDLDLFQ